MRELQVVINQLNSGEVKAPADSQMQHTLRWYVAATAALVAAVADDAAA